MGSWRPHGTLRAWEVWQPANLDDFPLDAVQASYEPCGCWSRGCQLTRHRVGGPAENPEAPDERPYRYEIFHARPAPAPSPEAKTRDRVDRKRAAAGERGDAYEG